jgi:excisionase family DNA binding protein
MSEKLYTIRQAAEFLGVNPGTIRRWALNKTLIGIKVGSRGDWRFKNRHLAKLITNPAVPKRKKKFTNIQKVLRDNADAIQKLAMAHHAQLIGSDALPAQQFKKYSEARIKIVKAIAYDLFDFKKATDCLKNSAMGSQKTRCGAG